MQDEQLSSENRFLNNIDFGEDFKWGVSVSAYQIEGAHLSDGKGHSIWDIFSNKKGNVLSEHNGNTACDFYNNFSSDIELLHSLHIPNFRFSLSWPRILPSGHWPPNSKGLDFYDRLIDACLDKGIEPWITLYHWDLPYEIEKKGGWTNRDIVAWFSEYAEVCVKKFGDRVKYWMVLNEPMVFTGSGYFLGIHAPGRKGLKNFVPSIHHAALAQAEGGRIIKSHLPFAEVGTTFSCSHIEPYRKIQRDIKAAKKVDALLNRLFLEPALGLGYPLEDLPVLKNIKKYIKPGDREKLKFDFDFIGVQNYTREIVKYSLFTPYLHANIIPANKRKVPSTVMNWEIHPPAIYEVLKKFSSYKNIKKIYITENGAAFEDTEEEGKVRDTDRLKYIQEHILQVHKAKEEGVNVQGYFVWSFLDNFEWSEGYHPRFGLVYIDFETQNRIVKASGHWYKDFLKSQRKVEAHLGDISKK
jgi:beta-glucosidase